MNSTQEFGSGGICERQGFGAEPGLGIWWLTHPVRGVVFSARMVCRKASGRRNDIVCVDGCWLPNAEICMTFFVVELGRARLGWRSISLWHPSSLKIKSSIETLPVPDRSTRKEMKKI
jgi:hypothetical protein